MFTSRIRNCCRFSAGAIAALVFLAVAPAFANPIIVFDTEMTKLNLSGGPFLMPLARDPGPLPGGFLGDSIEGYGFVDSLVSISLSSTHQSLGQAIAYLRGDVGNTGVASVIVPGSDPINPELLHGKTFQVSSFFDVYFDITVTDVDTRTGRDFAGQGDGASFVLANNGPANMQNFYEAIFDKDAPNFGLIPPPEVAPYLGHFTIEIPLGGDINGNGMNDKIKFTLAAHSVADVGRTFIILPDGTVIDEFNSYAYIEGSVVDVITDPPFTIGGVGPGGVPTIAFGGPTGVGSTLLNPLAVPEPSSFVLAMLGVVGAVAAGRMRKSNAV